MMWNADENKAGGSEQQSVDEQQEREDRSNGASGSANEGTSAKGNAPTEERRPRRRGFAAMDRDRVREIASKGGKAAHAAGTAHQFSSDEARVAGRKGGMAPHVRRGGVRRRPSEAASGSSDIGASSHGEHGGDNR